MSKQYFSILSIKRSDGKIFKQGDYIICTEDNQCDGKIFDFNIVDYGSGIVVITEDGHSLDIAVVEHKS